MRVIGNALSYGVYSSVVLDSANGKPRSPASTQVDAANFKFAACAREGVTCQIKSRCKAPPFDFMISRCHQNGSVLSIGFGRLSFSLLRSSVRFSRRDDLNPVRHFHVV